MQFAQVCKWLTTGRLRISFALAAYFSVEIVSAIFASAGDTHAIMQVWELPPKEFCNILAAA